jgi:hypothetical protein
MYITGVPETVKKELVAKRRRAAAIGFTTESEVEEDHQVRATPEAASIPSLANVLALQDVDSPIAREQEVYNHGHTLLEELDSYRKQIIMGGDATEILAGLKGKIDQTRHAADSEELESIVKEIELRALIEYAKKGDK